MSVFTPRIIYGTAWKKEATTDLVVKAVLNGFRAIDTACQPKHYREELVGQAISELERSHNISRSSLYVQTKFTSLDGQDLTKPIPYDAKAKVEDQVDQSVAASLEQLGVDYIDCLVMHSPMRTKDETLRAWRQLEQHHDRGVLKTLGISNIYSPSLLKWLIGESRVKLSVVQNRWFEGNSWDWEVFEICRKNGIMYQSFWTLSGNPTLLAHPTLKKLAEKYELTPEQALYKFCSIIGITPLSGTTSDTHMKHDIEVIKRKDFETSEVEAILSLMKQSGTSADASSKRRRRVKVHLELEDTPLSIPEDRSMRNLLLGNISEQHTLATKLFEALSQSLSASRRVNTSNTTLLTEVTEMYTRLEALTEEHAQLVELARKHRDRWERLHRKRKRKQALEDKVRRVLVQLQEGRREIEGIIDEGEEVLRGIGMATKAAIPIDKLINHATRLAPYTTRTAAAEPSHVASVPTQEVYYPLERLMMGSKLMRLARGEMIGAGEIGDKEVIGEDVQMLAATTNFEAQLAADVTQPAEPVPSQPPAQQVVRKPIKLDMLGSDSEDDSDDMDQAA